MFIRIVKNKWFIIIILFISEIGKQPHHKGCLRRKQNLKKLGSLHTQADNVNHIKCGMFLKIWYEESPIEL